MIRSFFAAALLSCGLVVPSFGQGGGLAGEFSVNPAPLGQPVILTVTEAQGTGISFPSSCVYVEIRQSSPTGPQVRSLICLSVIVPLGPGATASMSWNQLDDFGVPVGAGNYWFRVSYFGSAPGLSTQWFCLTIQNSPNDAALHTIAAPQVGSTALYQIQAPAMPGLSYACAASLSTDTGIGGGICLDQDFLFGLSFPQPDPALFLNFQGFTDANGIANGIGIPIPALPILANKPIHVQAAVFDGQGLLQITNLRSHAILP